MKNVNKKPDAARTPKKIRLPGFIMNSDVEEIGAGDLVSKVTGMIGLSPCGKCKDRAKKLNQRIVFTRRNE